MFAQVEGKESQFSFQNDGKNARVTPKVKVSAFLVVTEYICRNNLTGCYFCLCLFKRVYRKYI